LFNPRYIDVESFEVRQLALLNNGALTVSRVFRNSAMNLFCSAAHVSSFCVVAGGTKVE
jgi:hypothetical protein